MCTFQFSLNDEMVDRIRPALGNQIAVQKWMQEQLESAILQFASSMPQQDQTTKKHSLSHLRGIFSTGLSDEQLKEEHLKQKYDI